MRKIMLLGRVGKKPETGSTPNGARFVKFSLAVNTGKKNGHATSEWYDCTSWNDKQQDAIMQFVDKGAMLVVEGLPSVQAFQNKQGEIVGKITVAINQFYFAGGTKSDDKSSDEDVHKSADDIDVPVSDSVPF